MAENPKLKHRKIESIQDLMSVADKWDDLWERSEVCSPTAKAQLLALYVEHYACENNFVAIIVEDAEKRFLAALPLIAKHCKRFFKVASLATSHEVVGGDLLLDQCCESQKVLDFLVASLLNSPFSFFKFGRVAYKEKRWHELVAALHRADLLTRIQDNYIVGQVKIISDWPTYEKTLPKRHLRERRRGLKCMAREGDSVFEVITEIQSSEVNSLLMRGFEVEDRSWKGRAGTSVLKTPGMFEFCVRSAQQLAEHGQLRLSFLKHKGVPIAFCLICYSKGSHIVAKIGYDDSYARFGPGQLMLMCYLQYVHNLPRKENHLFDFGGPIMPWMEKWTNQSYPVGQILASTHKFPSRFLFRTYFWLKGPISNILRKEALRKEG